MKGQKSRELFQHMFYLCQTTATLLSPTKKGWKRKCVHSLSSETASESQQPQPQMFFPFPLKPTKHSLESFRSVFPIFFLVFATSDLTGRRAGRKNPLENPSPLPSSNPHRGFSHLSQVCQAAAGWFSLHPNIPGIGCEGEAAVEQQMPHHLPFPLRTN